MQTFLSILLVVLSAVVIVSIMLQESKTSGITGLMSGGNENYFAKNKIRTYEKTLARITTVSVIFFAIVVILMSIL